MVVVRVECRYLAVAMIDRLYLSEQFDLPETGLPQPVRVDYEPAEQVLLPEHSADAP